MPPTTTPMFNMEVTSELSKVLKEGVTGEKGASWVHSQAPHYSSAQCPTSQTLLRVLP